MTDLETAPLRIVADGLEVAGGVVPLRAARFPYWELAPVHWAAALEALGGLRVPIVRVDVPWSLHEPAPAVFEWGDRRPELALEHLLEELHARNLLAIVSPGPWLGDAAPHCGLPQHLAACAELLAVDPQGRTVPFPACASERFWSEACAWLEVLSARLERFVYPRGPLVARRFGAVGPVPSPWGGGLLDHSESALSFFSSFARVKYPPALAPIGRPPLDGPGDAAGLEHAIAWVEAGEAAQRAAVERAARAFGLEALPLILGVADDPPGSGLDPRAAGSRDAAVLEIGSDQAGDFAELRAAGMRAGDLEPLGGVAGLATAEPLLAAGRWLEPCFAASVACMSGARSLEVGPLWARPGALETGLAQDGELRGAVAEHWRGLFRSLDAIEHHALVRRTDCLLLCNRELAHLREACAATGALPARLAPPRVQNALRVAPRPLDGEDRPELDADVATAALFDGLCRAGIAFGLADSSLSADRLARERVAIAVTFGRLGRALAGRLFEWVEGGGALVIGPRLPVCDWLGDPLRIPLPIQVKERRPRVRVGALELEEVDILAGGEPLVEVREGVIAACAPFGAGRLVCFGFRPPWRAAERDPDELARLVRQLCGPLGIAPCYPTSDPRVETELWEGGVRRFLFLANPAHRESSVTVALRPDEALREVRGSGEYVRAGEPFRVPGRSVILRELVSL